MSLALPSVMQSGHTQLPARSKLPRRFGKSMHQHRDLPGRAPQLKLVPHSSHTSLSMGSPNITPFARACAIGRPKSNNFCVTISGFSLVTDGQSQFLIRKHLAVSTANWSKLNDRKIFAIFGEFLLRLVRCWAISLVLLPPAGFYKLQQTALLRA